MLLRIWLACQRKLSLFYATALGSCHARLPFHCTSTLAWQTSPTHKFRRWVATSLLTIFLCRRPFEAASSGWSWTRSPNLLALQHRAVWRHTLAIPPLQTTAGTVFPKMKLNPCFQNQSQACTGPAYDSFFSHAQHATSNVASSSMQPGMGIPQPDGSVLPISVTHDMTPLPSNQFNVHEGFPLGMRLLCSKIHPLCYARMLQTMSDYALGVSLLCS